MEKFEFKPRSFCRAVRVFKKNCQREPIDEEELIWINMKLDLVIRWEWYFRYRAALLQVKYPKHYVEVISWSVEPDGRTAEHIAADIRKRRMTTCRSMITKINNKLKAYETEENGKLLPNWENEFYLKAKQKIREYKLELLLLK